MSDDFVLIETVGRYGGQPGTKAASGWGQSQCKSQAPPRPVPALVDWCCGGEGSKELRVVQRLQRLFADLVGHLGEAPCFPLREELCSPAWRLDLNTAQAGGTTRQGGWGAGGLCL